MEHLTGFGQGTALQMLKHLFSSYRVMDEIELNKKAVNMMETYGLAKPLANLLN